MCRVYMFIFPPPAVWTYPTGPCWLCVILLVYGRWNINDVSVFKLSNVSFRGKCPPFGNTLNLPSPTNLARLGHFPPASQAGCLAGQVFYVVYVFSLSMDLHGVPISSTSSMYVPGVCLSTTSSSVWDQRHLMWIRIADPYLWVLDPERTPFFIEFKDAKKKFHIFF
jgi:hypothetical protein